jgi:hypothetical protein
MGYRRRACDVAGSVRLGDHGSIPCIRARTRRSSPIAHRLPNPNLAGSDSDCLFGHQSINETCVHQRVNDQPSVTLRQGRIDRRALNRLSRFVFIGHGCVWPYNAAFGRGLRYLRRAAPVSLLLNDAGAATPCKDHLDPRRLQRLRCVAGVARRFRCTADSNQTKRQMTHSAEPISTSGAQTLVFELESLCPRRDRGDSPPRPRRPS